MYDLIVCLSCGHIMGDIYDAFVQMRKDAYEEVLGSFGADIDPMVLALTEHVTVDLSPVFEELGVDNMCCKTHLGAQVRFAALY